MHKFKEAHDHIKALNYLASALKLSKEEQALHILMSDSKASLINAWCMNFPHMLQEHYSLHFIKNIIDKLQYLYHTNLLKRRSRMSLPCLTDHLHSSVCLIYLLNR